MTFKLTIGVLNFSKKKKKLRCMYEICEKCRLRKLFAEPGVWRFPYKKTLLVEEM